jgi:hypothetical protein
MFLAHGIGGRADLPVPLWLALYGAGMAVVISFFAVMAFWTESKLRGGEAGRPLPPAVERTADHSVSRVVARVVGLVVTAIVLSVAWFGPADSARNAASTWFYVWFWVGLGVVSAVVGPFWRWLNPLRTIASALRAVVGRVVRLPDLPDAVGYWPAAASLVAFTWLELVYDHADVPHTVFAFLVGYGAVHTVAGVVFGERWFDRGDGFEVYSSLLGHLSPIGRRADGRLVLRNPLDGMATLRPAPGLVFTVSVLLGSTGFDGLSRSRLWRGFTGGEPRPVHLLVGTVGLLAVVAFVLFTYWAANRASRKYARTRRSAGIEVRFVHSLLPIALGYSIAHYFSFAVFQGQAGYLLANDPLGRGWNLFGLAGRGIDYTAVSPRTIALVQIGAIVVAHIVGVIAAHDRAVLTFTRRYLRRGQYALLTAMVAYTLVGIALVIGS